MADRVELSPVSSSMGLALSDYYQWVNNSSFYAMASPYMYPFYQQWVRVFDYWINGMVPYFHDASSGLIPTNLARTLVDRVASLVLGGGLMFENANKEQNTNDFNEALDFISNKWSKRVDLLGNTMQMLKQTAGLGSCAMKLNCDKKIQLWVDTVPMNRGFFDLGSNGEILKAKCWINIYTETVGGKRGVQYGLVEERYYNEKEKPCVCYQVYQMSAKVNTFVPAPALILSYHQLPAWLRDCLVNDYGKIRIGEPMILPFEDLGIYLFRWTPSITVMPQLKFGDSVLTNILNYLAQYDYLNAIQVTEMYSGRARILLPKALSSRATKNQSGAPNYNAGLDSFIYTLYESMSTDDQKPEFIQAEIRAEQLKTIRNIILENIATAVGISPSSFASYLQDSSNRTAREVSAEESATTLFVESKRMGITAPFNEMIKTVLRFYGFVDDVVVKFSKAGQSNYTLLVENVTKLYQAGLMSKEQALAALNPAKDQFQISEELKRIEIEEQQKQIQQSSMFGEFGTGDKIE